MDDDELLNWLNDPAVLEDYSTDEEDPNSFEFDNDEYDGEDWMEDVRRSIQQNRTNFKPRVQSTEPISVSVRIQTPPPNDISTATANEAEVDMPSTSTDYQDVLVDANYELHTASNSCGVFQGDKSLIDPSSSEFKKVRWKKNKMRIHSNEIGYRGSFDCPAEVEELRTPYDFFMYFVTDTFFEHVANQTNIYAIQKNINTRFKTDASEIRKYFGILMYSSVYKYPNFRAYWGRNGFSAIQAALTVNRFEEIRKFIHFNDSTTMPAKDGSNSDVLHKIRPVIDHFNNRFSLIPMSQRLCVDEQMCSTKMKATQIRQYMPNKPHKWGFKLFVLCDTVGFSYKFEVYTGNHCQ